MSETKTMSVTQGLSQYKLLGKRINKMIGELTPTVSYKGENGIPQGYVSRDTFSDRAKAQYQAIIDLVDFRDKIKAAIVKSNAVTEVEIADIKMTVAEAIERKNKFDMLKTIRQTLARQAMTVNTKVEMSNDRMEMNLDRIIASNFEGSSSAPKKDEIENIAKPYKAINEWHILDPLGVNDVVAKLDAATSAFEENVDFVLSESNATTKITV